jgi:hypothetical protein
LNKIKIHIQGLNFRLSDREAIAGICRKLKNLFPSGNADAPVWKPAAEAKPFYTLEQGRTVKSQFIWNLRDKTSKLLFLAENSSGLDAISYVELTNTGELSESGLEEDGTDIYTFSDESAGRKARFSQIGDHVLISIIKGGEPEAFLMAFFDGDITYCVDANFPTIPEVTFPDDNKANPITLETDETRQFCYFGFRYAYELKDGTYTKLSGVIIRASNKVARDLFYINRAANVGTTTVGVNVRRPGGSSRGPDDARGTSTVTATKYFGDAYCTVQGPVSIDTRYKSLIKGIAIFVSEPKNSVKEVLEDSIFYRYGILSNIFESSGPISLLISINDAELVTYPILEEDNLGAHAIIPSEVFSYNKMLIAGNVRYDFAPPFSLSGNFVAPRVVTPPTVPTGLSQSYSINAAETLATFVLSWASPNASSYAIECFYDGDMVFQDSNGQTYRKSMRDYQEPIVTTGLTATAIIPLVMMNQETRQIAYAISATVRFKIRSVSIDGLKSDFAYFDEIILIQPTSLVMGGINVSLYDEGDHPVATVVLNYSFVNDIDNIKQVEFQACYSGVEMEDEYSRTFIVDDMDWYNIGVEQDTKVRLFAIPIETYRMVQAPITSENWPGVIPALYTTGTFHFRGRLAFKNGVYSDWTALGDYRIVGR